MQCDCWRPLRLPAILVADAKLGGISTSLSAYETLLSRGYDVPFVVMANGKHARVNSLAVHANVEPDTTVVVLPRSLPDAPHSRWAPACLLWHSMDAPKGWHYSPSNKVIKRALQAKRFVVFARLTPYSTQLPHRI